MRRLDLSQPVRPVVPVRRARRPAPAGKDPGDDCLAEDPRQRPARERANEEKPDTADQGHVDRFA